MRSDCRKSQFPASHMQHYTTTSQPMSISEISFTLRKPVKIIEFPTYECGWMVALNFLYASWFKEDSKPP